MVLICDRRKEHIDKSKEKKNTMSQETNCVFDMITILEKEDCMY